MNDYQEVQYKMTLGVQNFFAVNPELTKKNTILKNHVDKFDGLMVDWATLIEEQSFDIKGYTSEKHKGKTNLSETVFGLTSSVHSFAVDTKNDILLEEFRLSVSRINKLSDVSIVNYAKTLSHTLQQYKEELKLYQVTEADMEKLTAETSLYSKLLLKPAEERKDRAITTENIKKTLSKVLNVLNDSIDYDMEHYKDAEPAIFEKYRKLREIDDSATHALSVKGLVLSAHEAAHVLQHVRVTAQFKAGSALKEMKTTTSAKGNYQFKGIPDGKCSVTFELEYYDSLTKDIAVYSNEATQLDVEMIKTV